MPFLLLYTLFREVLTLEEVVAYEKINLVIGHRDFKKENLKPFANNIEKIIDLDCWHGNYEADPTLFDRKFIIENAEKLTWIYNELQDKDSKDALVGYINQKISMDYKYLKSVYRKEGQYFDSGIIKLYDNESFVDCGAYIGDTAEEFVKRINRQFIKPCVAWELIFWKTLTEYFQDLLKKLMDFRLVYHALQTYRLNCYALNLMREVIE